MRKLMMCTLVVGACLAASPATAATACFDYACIAGNCDFDASCSSASPFIYRYVFDFGDGSSILVTSDPTQFHEYSHGGSEDDKRNVTLSLLYWDEPGETVVNCDVVIQTTVGPQDYITGRCSHSD